LSSIPGRIAAIFTPQGSGRSDIGARDDPHYDTACHCGFVRRDAGGRYFHRSVVKVRQTPIF
jgi:hypothetical protein